MKYLDLTGLQKLWAKIKTHVQTSLEGYAKKTDLSTVATSGSYNDLTDKPTIPSGGTITQTPSEGLTYTLSEDGNSYILSDRGTCTDTDIVIPSTYNEKPVIGIRNNAFTGYSIIFSVVIPDSVTTIGDYAFYNCPNLTGVTIGNSVTSIGKAAFRQCPSLIDIVIPKSVTSIGEYAFSDCTSLAKIVIPDSVTSIGERAFSNCNNLTIYCEATEKPSDWNANWNNSNCPVVWGAAMDILGLNDKFADYVTETELTEKGYLTEHQSLEGLASEEFVEEQVSSVSSITDLGEQEDHKYAQQVMVDHLMQMNAEDGCYLFKYYCSCKGNACFAVVAYKNNDGVGYIEGTVYDSFRSFRQFCYNSIYGFTLDGCWLNIACFDEEQAPLKTENKTVINAINELNSKIGSGGGGVGLSMPRIRLANWYYDEVPAFVEDTKEFLSGKIVFSVNVQDGTVQEGDELQVCAVRRTFGKKKLRPILSKTITAEDIENLAKQPYLQISTDDYSGNNLGRDWDYAMLSFYRTDSSDANRNKPKYIRIRRPIYKEGCEGPVNAFFSNVVPVDITLKYVGHI